MNMDQQHDMLCGKLGDFSTTVSEGRRCLNITKLSRKISIASIIITSTSISISIINYQYHIYHPSSIIESVIQKLSTKWTNKTLRSVFLSCPFSDFLISSHSSQFFQPGQSYFMTSAQGWWQGKLPKLERNCALFLTCLFRPENSL